MRTIELRVTGLFLMHKEDLSASQDIIYTVKVMNNYDSYFIQ